MYVPSRRCAGEDPTRRATMNKKDNLYKEIMLFEKRIEKNKIKRTVITIVVFAIAFFATFVFLGKPVTLLDYLGDVVASIVLAGIYFVVNGLIFSQLIEAGRSEDRALENMKKRYSELKD